MGADRIVLHADAVPVCGAAVVIFRTEREARSKPFCQRRRAHLVNGESIRRIFQVFDFLERKYVLVNGIVQRNRPLCQASNMAHEEGQDENEGYPFDSHATHSITKVREEDLGCKSAAPRRRLKGLRGLKKFEKLGALKVSQARCADSKIPFCLGTPCGSDMSVSSRFCG